MFKTIKIFIVLVATAMATQAQAQSPVAMVLSISGDVVLEIPGKPVKLEPFSRLLEGDRVKLGSDARVSFVYPRSGRQEDWSGSGAVLTGSSESTQAGGKPRLEVKQLPTKVAQQLARTPVSDTSGKAGMVRMRAIASADTLDVLEKQYAKMRVEAVPSDRSPEIFFLAGLNDMGMNERIKEELTRMGKEYPNDATIKALTKAYAKAMGGEY